MRLHFSADVYIITIPLHDRCIEKSCSKILSFMKINYFKYGMRMACCILQSWLALQSWTENLKVAALRQRSQSWAKTQDKTGQYNTKRQSSWALSRTLRDLYVTSSPGHSKFSTFLSHAQDVNAERNAGALCENAKQFFPPVSLHSHHHLESHSQNSYLQTAGIHVIVWELAIVPTEIVGPRIGTGGVAGTRVSLSGRIRTKIRFWLRTERTAAIVAAFMSIFDTVSLQKKRCLNPWIEARKHYI